MSRPLRDSRLVVLDSTGTGTVTFGPQRNPWRVQRISVLVNSNENEPQANIYRGTVSPGTLISGTYSGSNDTDSEINDGILHPGEYYTCQWTGGDVGARATVTFYGVEESGF